MDEACAGVLRAVEIDFSMSLVIAIIDLSSRRESFSGSELGGGEGLASSLRVLRMDVRRQSVCVAVLSVSISGGDSRDSVRSSQEKKRDWSRSAAEASAAAGEEALSSRRVGESEELGGG
jgi:hypothetical protein